MATVLLAQALVTLLPPVIKGISDIVVAVNRDPSVSAEDRAKLRAELYAMADAVEATPLPNKQPV